jgi:bis(5'-nucleosyl)-tetraphosphatase (symmetrical)
MIYLMGDVQGCCGPLQGMLDKLGFSPSRDHLYVLGDLVNRGPGSLKTLQILQALSSSATCLLGNHDLHLLAVAHGVRRPHRSDTLDDILQSPDREAWLDWLRQQRLAVHAHGWLMVHAGVLPQWDMDQTLSLAGEVEAMLRGPNLAAFLPQMYGNHPARWDDSLQGADRWRCVVNAMTRLRFCAADGEMEFATKDGGGESPAGFMPWFDVPGRRTAASRVAFGHWSTLGLINRPDLLSLDTGCIWGGRLTAVRLEDAPGSEHGTVREVIQLSCPQAQQPGA